MNQIQGTGSILLDDVYELLKTGKDIEDKMSYSHPFKTNGKSVRMTIGRVWFQTLFPDDWPLVDEPVDNSKLDTIVKGILKKYEPEVAADLVSHILREGFKLATLVPSSFSIDTFIPPEDWLELKKAFVEKYDAMPREDIDIQKFTKESNALTSKLLQHMNKSDFKIQNVLNSGSKGNAIDDWKALVVSKGFILDIEGNIRGPITRGTSEGYSTSQYYDAASQARRNYYYKAAMTAKPGYLARKVTMSNANVIVDHTRKDCRTKKYYELFVDSKKAKLLRGRYHVVKNELVEIKEPADVLNKTIQLRSPLYCRAKKGLCPVCYGNHYKTVGTENVGILAGGAINMIAVNALMKMRHKSSQIDIIDVDFITDMKNTSQDQKIIDSTIAIRKKEIIAKSDCTVLINKSDYDETSLIDTGEVFIIPGILNLYVGDMSDNNFINFPFGFSIHLHKPDDYTIEGKTISLKYTTGEKIISQEYYTEQTEPSIIDRLLGGSLKYINSPVLTRVKNTYHGFDTYDVEPKTIPDVLAERPVVVYGKYKNNVDGTITLKGFAGKKRFKKTFKVSDTTPDKRNSAIRYLWARERIKLLDDYNRLSSTDSRIKEVTDLGLKYNLMTAYTSFLAVDENKISNEGTVKTVKQALPLPQRVHLLKC